MQRPWLLFILIFIVFINCAYCFPEKLPAPLDFDTYTFDRVKFGQTSVGEFSYIAPGYAKPEVEGVYTIFSEKNLNNSYKAARIGFKDNFLDWIELEFAVPQSITIFKKNYGEPKLVNKEYSNKFNYLDYGFFNVVTDKNNAVCYAITLYGESDFNPSIKNVVDKIPSYKALNSLSDLEPGKMMENDFKTLYSGFLPTKNNTENARNTYSIPKKYLKHNNYYSAIDLVFSNGMLSFINLKPKNMNIHDVKEIYGEGKILDNTIGKAGIKEYPNFIITYDKETNRVLNIGIISLAQ